MADAVAFSIDGAVGEALIDNPPVNAASHAVRLGLVAAVQRFEQDPALKCLIIRCAGRSFVAGADIREFGKPMGEPVLPEVLRVVERATKPVVAAIHGTALGGGLELALACHYRIANGSARFGLPEVKLGIVPGAGGTQRLPRLVGLDRAIAMISEGNEISAADAKAQGLIDEIVEGDLADGARRYAIELVAANAAVRRTGDLPLPPANDAKLAEAKTALAKKKRGFIAPQKAIEAIGFGYQFSFDEALAREAALCRELIASPQSRALRHIFAAEREVLKVPGLPAGLALRAITRTAVIGLGLMGRGIVMALLNAGFQVTAIAKDEAHRRDAETAIRKAYSGLVAKGSLSQEKMDERFSRLAFAVGFQSLDTADLVIEAASEVMDQKRALFSTMGAKTRPGAILATNTSYLDIDTLAEASGRPADVCGMHFFNPANVMRLLEIVKGKDTAPDLIATAMDFAKRIGKLPVLTGVCDGFIVNRMLSKRSRECYFLLEEGATPAQIDKVVTGFGFPMGPFALNDLAGIDLQYAARQARLARLSPREKRADFVDQLFARGTFGQKTGSGWYRYDENRKAMPNPDSEEIIVAHAARHGLTRRAIADDEVLHRLLFAMINEGAKLLDEGIVPRPHEVDVAMVNAIGFPSYTGGPLFWADELGLKAVADEITRFGREQGEDYWQPARTLLRLAQSGGRFYS